MKFAVVILALVAAVSAQFSNGQYNPFSPYSQYNRFKTYPTPAPFRRVTPTVIAPTPFSVVPTPTPVPARVQVRVESRDAAAETLRSGNEINPDGSYSYFYETNNGIAAQEQGTPRNFGGNPPVIPDVAQGSFSWTSPEGVPIVISYVADENGYQPSGDAIPTPPPVPAQIARALEYIARSATKK